MLSYKDPSPFSSALPIWIGPETEGVNLYADFFLPLTVLAGRSYSLTVAADADLAIYDGDSPRPLFFHLFPDDGITGTRETVVLTPWLSTGEHLLKITVYCPNADFSTYRKNRPYLRFLLTEDGIPVLRSDERILCRKNPCYRSGDVPKVSSQLGYSFDYDGTIRELPEAIPATVIDGLPRDTAVRQLPRLDLSQEITPKEILSGTWKDGSDSADRPAKRMQDAVLDEADCPYAYSVYDLSREETGYLAIRTNAPAPTELLIGYGEFLESGRCRTAIGNRNFAFRIKVPAGHFEFFAPFLRLGLRYLQIFAAGGEISVVPTLVRAVYPVTEKPLYAPVGTIHERIERVARHTLHLCMHDHFEDCPWREQALYAMDGRSEMLAAYYAFGETAISAASLRLLARSLRDDSLLELCAPARVSITIPGFSAAFVIAVKEYFDRSGDGDTVDELLPVCYEILSGFYGRMKHHGWLLPAYRQKEYWNFYEWSDGLAGSIGKEGSPCEMTYDAPLMALVSMAFTAYGELLMKLGTLRKDPDVYDKGDAALHCSEELNERLNEYFWDDAAGLYRTRLGVSLSDASPYPLDPPHFAELTQELCVVCGAADARLPALLDRIYRRDGMIPSTLSMGIFRYEALMRSPDVYGSKVLNELAERFGRMLEAGATTFWETDLGARDFGGAGSLCHGWSAFPIYLYAKYGALFFGEKQSTDPTREDGTSE